MPLHAHPERRTGAELLYANEKKFRRYVPTSRSSSARLRHIAAPSNYGEDEHSPFTLILAKVVVNHVEVSADMGVIPNESPVTQANRAAPPTSKNLSARIPPQTLAKRVARSETGDHPRGANANNSQRASAPVIDDISTTPSLPNSPIDVDALPDRLSDMQPVLMGRQARKDWPQSQHDHVSKKQKRG